jgi:hypothetical protein
VQVLVDALRLKHLETNPTQSYVTSVPKYNRRPKNGQIEEHIGLFQVESADYLAPNVHVHQIVRARHVGKGIKGYVLLRSFPVQTWKKAQGESTALKIQNRQQNLETNHHHPSCR